MVKAKIKKGTRGPVKINGSVSGRGFKQKEKIIKSAGRLFWQKSYLGTSIDDIAKAASVNKATIYYYFKGKNRILYEIAERVMHELFALTKFDDDIPAEKRLELLIFRHVTWETTHPGFAGIGQYERRNLTPKLLRSFNDMRDEYEAIFRKTIAEVLAASGANHIDEKLGSMFVLGLINSIMQWYSPGGTLTNEEIANRAIRFIMAGLRG